MNCGNCPAEYAAAGLHRSKELVREYTVCSKIVAAERVPISPEICSVFDGWYVMQSEHHPEFQPKSEATTRKMKPRF